MASNQPDTFASVKKRWRARSDKSSVLAKEAGEIGARLTNSVLEGSTVVYQCCAFELESGLEQQVRALRDQCAEDEDLYIRRVADQLTALLGEEPK